LQGNFQAAEAGAKRASDLDPSFFFAQFLGGYADIEAGRLRDAIPKLRRASAMDSPPFVPAWLGYAYGATGDRERAMDYRERAYAAHSQWMTHLKMDRIFAPLRSEPRFIALLKKLNFDQ
jgi:tetratricopeptide (TPR) repeat protein